MTVTAAQFWFIVAILLGIGVITSLLRFPLMTTFFGTMPHIHNEWEEEFDEFTSKYTAAATLDLLPSLLVEAVLLTLAIILGLLLAQSIHLGTPFLEALLRGENSIDSFQRVILPGLWFGISLGLVLLLMERLFFRKRLRRIVHVVPTRWSLWKFILASFHVGIALEILWRLFALSLIAWILSRIWHTSTGEATLPVLWIANLLVSILSTVLYVRTVLFTSAMTAMVSPLIFTRTLLLDGLLGSIFGYLFWQYGLEAAITAHLVAGVFLQVFAGRLPLSIPLSKEVSGPLLEEYKRRFGVQITDLRGVPRLEFPDLHPPRPRNR